MGSDWKRPSWATFSAAYSRTKIRTSRTCQPSSSAAVIFSTIRFFDFQEVVSKGVAIECARRFFDEDEHTGDFSSVTYNRMHLVLDPDQRALQLKVFTPTDGNPLPPTNKHGVSQASVKTYPKRSAQKY
jgi:hypothetical protein